MRILALVEGKWVRMGGERWKLNSTGRSKKKFYSEHMHQFIGIRVELRGSWNVWTNPVVAVFLVEG